MESVIQKIRQHRVDESKKCSVPNTSEIVVNGCPVTLRFDPVGDPNVLPAVQAMLIATFFDAMTCSGGTT